MFFPAALALSLAAPLFQAPQTAPRDGLALLKEVEERYANAKSYRIEAIQEQTAESELQRSWQKTMLKAIMMPGGRYRYEGHGGSGWSIYVSNGATQWVYHANEHFYTQTPAESEAPKRRLIDMEEMPAQMALRLVGIQAHRADGLNSAALLPEQTISVGGKNIRCDVVHYSQDDLKKKRADEKLDMTIWIDKQNKTVVKTLNQSQSYRASPHVLVSVETSVVYTLNELDQPQPADSFRFVPPSDAKLVDEFPNVLRHSSDAIAAKMLDKPAPELVLKAADGKVLSLSGLRGKPVFLEFWATWCAPCVDVIPDLKKLYSETQPKGLAWISIDNDHDAGTATAFLAHEQVPWSNYHDEDGSMGEAFHRESVPLAVLIEGSGKVSFYKSGYEIQDLRNAISKLGPEFSAIAPSVNPESRANTE